MVNVAQSVERQVVVLVAVGSIPTIHPIFIWKYAKIIVADGPKKIYIIYVYKISWNIRGVAQFGSALALGARGCQFESGHPDHIFNLKKGLQWSIFAL